MKRENNELFIFLDDTLVGSWTMDNNLSHQFTYSTSYLQQPQRNAISLSLPLTSIVYKGDVVRNYFENLISENESLRQSIKRTFNCESTQAFDILAEIGADCVGAIKILPEKEVKHPEKNLTMKPIDDAHIAQIIREGGTFSKWQDSSNNNFRISIAGEQAKTALLSYNGSWFIPTKNTPTTHICKFPIGRIGNIGLSDSVEIEWCTSLLYRLLGGKVASSSIYYADGQKMLCVERFDRVLHSDKTRIQRIIQEDMCQALSYPSAQKYQVDGGPGILEIDTLLKGSAHKRDRMTFYTSIIIHYLMTTIDAHAKNYSIHLVENENYYLTPLYDLLSIYPIMGKKGDQIPPQKVRMAMSLARSNNHYNWNSTAKGHLKDTGILLGFTPIQIELLLDEIYEIIPKAISQCKDAVPSSIPPYIPGRTCEGLEKMKQKIFN